MDEQHSFYLCLDCQEVWLDSHGPCASDRTLNHTWYEHLDDQRCRAFLAVSRVLIGSMPGPSSSSPVSSSTSSRLGIWAFCKSNMSPNPDAHDNIYSIHQSLNPLLLAQELRAVRPIPEVFQQMVRALQQQGRRMASRTDQDKSISPDDLLGHPDDIQMICQYNDEKMFDEEPTSMSSLAKTRLPPSISLSSIASLHPNNNKTTGNEAMPVLPYDTLSCTSLSPCTPPSYYLHLPVLLACVDPESHIEHQVIWWACFDHCKQVSLSSRLNDLLGDPFHGDQQPVWLQYYSMAAGITDSGVASTIADTDATTASPYKRNRPRILSRLADLPRPWREWRIDTALSSSQPLTLDWLHQHRDSLTLMHPPYIVSCAAAVESQRQVKALAKSRALSVAVREGKREAKLQTKLQAKRQSGSSAEEAEAASAIASTIASTRASKSPRHVQIQQQEQQVVEHQMVQHQAHFFWPFFANQLAKLSLLKQHAFWVASQGWIAQLLVIEHIYESSSASSSEDHGLQKRRFTRCRVRLNPYQCCTATTATSPAAKLEQGSKPNDLIGEMTRHQQWIHENRDMFLVMPLDIFAPMDISIPSALLYSIWNG